LLLCAVGGGAQPRKCVEPVFFNIKKDKNFEPVLVYK
jgi:hypothetical protein